MARLVVPSAMIRDFFTVYRCERCGRRVYPFTYSVANAAFGLCWRGWWCNARA